MTTISVKTENRGYDGKRIDNIYIVELSTEMKEKCLSFANEIITGNNQYTRLLPKDIESPKDKAIIEIQRTFAGKLGEYAFYYFLQYKNKTVNLDGMFEIYDGEQNVDEQDFRTIHNHSIDIKTGMLDTNRYLLVPLDQFVNSPKDIYVAVRFNSPIINKARKIFDVNAATHAEILGYAEYPYLERQRIQNLGEGPARLLEYQKLYGIDRLLSTEF